MSLDPLTELPEDIRAGTTVKWERTYSDFPSATWTLTFYMNGASQFKAGAGTAATPRAGTTATYDFAIAPADTDAMTPGEYAWEEIASDGTDTYVAARGRLVLSQKIAGAAAGSTLSQAEKELAILDAAIEGRLTDDIKSYVIAGRSVEMIEPELLLRLRAEREEAIWRLRNPGKLGPQALVTFTNP